MPIAPDPGEPLLHFGGSSAESYLLMMDCWSTYFKNMYPAFGLGLPSESTTLAYYAQNIYGVIMGTGSSSYPGVDNPDVKEKTKAIMANNILLNRYDTFAQIMARTFLSAYEQSLLKTRPSGWNLPPVGSGPSSLHILDAHLTRMNGNSQNAPDLPTYTITVTATTGGSLPATTSGNAPRVKISLVGLYDDWETLPTAAATQVAISGGNNAYTLGGLTSNVPTGVYKLRIYRQMFGAASDEPYYWDQDVTVVPEVAWSSYTVKLTKPDIALTTWIQPPSWLCCLPTPEFAAIYAAAFGSRKTTEGYEAQPLTLYDYAMLSASNVHMNPADEFAGLYNPSQTMEFGRWLTNAYTAGSPQLANDANNGLQGYAGSTKLRGRVLQNMNGNGSITATYSYYDEAHPKTLQTGATVAIALGASAVAGTEASATITAGRLIQAVTAINSGTSTTGEFVVEPEPIRTI